MTRTMSALDLRARGRHTSVMASIWLAVFLAAGARATPESSWGTDTTAHFVVHHENAGGSPADDNLLERLYEALHPVLWTLTPWMTDTKVDVYLYANRDSFLKGRFSPPKWSGGLMRDADGVKELAIYEPIDASVAAHELTHLYFHSYFDEKSSSPPPWLDEGLAVDLQNQALTPPDPRDKGPVLGGSIPMKVFLASRPAEDAPGAVVSFWYQQAASVVMFLRAGHVPSLFFDFCAKLRDGAGTAEALREVYGYDDPEAFEKAWLAWRPKAAPGMPVGLQTR